jgi:hypothetical protein
MHKLAISNGFFFAVLFAVTTTTLAQTSGPTVQGIDATHLTFDVVSIKRNLSGPGPAMIISPPDSDQVIVRNAPPREIIGEAYGIRLHDQITGLPGWADSENYDIDAKIAESDAAAFHRLLPMQRNPICNPSSPAAFTSYSTSKPKRSPPMPWSSPKATRRPRQI